MSLLGEHYVRQLSGNQQFGKLLVNCWCQNISEVMSEIFRSDVVVTSLQTGPIGLLALLYTQCTTCCRIISAVISSTDKKHQRSGVDDFLSVTKVSQLRPV